MPNRGKWIVSRIAAKNSFALIVAALHEGALPEIDGVTSFSNWDETDFIRTTEQPERCTNLDFRTGHFQLRELFLKSMALQEPTNSQEYAFSK